MKGNCGLRIWKGGKEKGREGGAVSPSVTLGEEKMAEARSPGRENTNNNENHDGNSHE